jgi:hypothetical protein
MVSVLKKPFVAFAAVTVAGLGVAAPATAASFPDAGQAAQVSSAKSAKATPWSPWKPVPDDKPDTLMGCGNKLTFSQAVNRQQQRFRTDRDGNFHLQIRGTYHQRINPVRGHTVVVNISGPSKYTFYRSGDFYYTATGLNAFTVGPRMYRNSTATKLPRLFISTGTLAIFLDSNGTRKSGDDQFTFLDQPTRYWNICPILKSGVVPRPFRV